MSKKNRYLILLLFFGLFAIIAPLIIFYTSGYRYNLAKNKVEKTGILLLETDQTNANIFIDDQLTLGGKQGNSRRFTNLLPGYYQIKIEKPGYYSWQKKLEINSQITTFANNITLFRQEAPLPLLTAAFKIATYRLSPDKKSLLVISATGAIYLINLDNRLEQTLINYLDPGVGNNISQILWSPLGEKVLLTTATNENYIIRLDTTQINRLTNSGWNNFNWSESDQAILYSNKKQQLYQIDTEKNITSPINIMGSEKITGEIIAFTNQESHLFLVIKNTTDVRIYDYNQATNQLITSKPLFLSPAVQFFAAPNGYLTITDGKTLLIINDQLELVITASAKAARWISANELLYYNDFEIYTYNLATKRSEVINRYSQIITAAEWYSNKKYLVVNLNNSQIDIIELDNRDQRNIWTMAEMSSITNLTLDDSGDYLYFIGITKNGENSSPQRLYSQKIH